MRHILTGKKLVKSQIILVGIKLFWILETSTDWFCQSEFRPISSKKFEYDLTSFLIIYFTGQTLCQNNEQAGGHLIFRAFFLTFLWAFCQVKRHHRAWWLLRLSLTILLLRRKFTVVVVMYIVVVYFFCHLFKSRRGRRNLE